jgi:putative ABC transport system substrate-binding protein
MRRREFIAGVGGAAAVSVFAAPALRAQQTERTRRIGVLAGLAEGDPETQLRRNALEGGLEQFGWVANRNVQIAYRWAAGDADRIQDYAAELAGLNPDVILVANTPALAALRRQTDTIPIVFVGVSDPVGDGFVANLARPAGNITGFSNYEPAMGGKWLELLKAIAPRTVRIALLFNPDTAPHSIFLDTIRAAAPSFAAELISAPVRASAEIERTLGALAREPNSGLIVMPDTFTFVRRNMITALASHHRLPAIYPFRVFAASGGLLSYGVELVAQYRQAATYIDQILKGTKPSDLPVQAPTKFELVINLTAAKVLGLEIPPSLLAIADGVIE